MSPRRQRRGSRNPTVGSALVAEAEMNLIRRQHGTKCQAEVGTRRLCSREGKAVDSSGVRWCAQHAPGVSEARRKEKWKVMEERRTAAVAARATYEAHTTRCTDYVRALATDGDPHAIEIMKDAPEDMR